MKHTFSYEILSELLFSCVQYPKANTEREVHVLEREKKKVNISKVLTMA